MLGSRIAVSPSLAALAVSLAAAGAGCTATGFIVGDPPDGGDGRSAADGGPGPAADPPDAGPPPPPVAVALIRLLSGAEYRATVLDLLGVEASASIDHVSIAGGYDTGAEGQVQESLFSALAAEAERLADVAVTTALPARFPCLAAPDEACARDLVTVLGRRALRRPVEPAYADSLVTFFVESSALSGSPIQGAKAVVARLLLAPEFLYRPEVGRVGPGGLRHLDAFEQASLVAYAITGSMPDDALLGAAEAAHAAGRSLDASTIRAEVRRLVATPRGEARVAALVRQWVRATALDEMVVRPEDYPKLGDPAVGVALREGLDAFVREIVRGDGSLRSLLDSPFAMVNRHSAPLVGASVEGDALVRVDLPTTERRGLLTQPGVLAALGASGDADKDRPVQRGYMLKTQLLCEPVGPPSGLNTTVAADTAARIPGFDQMTTRQQYEAMMEQGAACSTCHETFMPLGFAFGRYDALGRHRTVQRGQMVDATALGVPFLGELRDFADGLAVSDAMSSHPAVGACFTKNVVAFVTGVGGMPSVDAIAQVIVADRGSAPTVLGVLEDAVVHAALVAREPGPDRGTPPSLDGGVASMDAGGQGAPDAGAMDASAPRAEQLLESGEELRPNESRSAHGGRFTFTYQGDGNLVLYEGSRPLWHTATNGQRAYLAAMQGDGNLVVYARATEPIFHTATHGNPGAALYILDNGVLEIRAPDGRVLFATPVPN